MQEANITSYGWNVVDSILSIDWDSDENWAAVNARVLLRKDVHARQAVQQAGVVVGRKGKDASWYMHVLTYLHCSYLPNDSRKERNDIAELKIEENRGQSHMHDSDNESGSGLGWGGGGGPQQRVSSPIPFSWWASDDL